MNNRSQAGQPKLNSIFKRRRKLRSLILTGLFVLVIILLLFQLFQSHEQKLQLHHQLITTQESFARQHRHYQRLKLNVRQLHSKSYLEQLARERFGYHKPGETIYRLPNEIAKDVVNK